MRVLILSITAGYGHHATAQAVKAELESRGAEVLIVDLFQYVSKLLYDTVDKGYLLSVKYASRPYRKVYTALETKELLRRATSTLAGKDLVAAKFSKFFKGYLPDVIICTHPFAAQTINELKEAGRLAIPAVGIVTDYTIHPYWEEVPNIDYILLGSELMRHSAQLKGIDASRLICFGIPVQPKFSVKGDKLEARRQLGLDENKMTILLMGGSMGHGNMLRFASLIDAMDIDLQIVCICGNNKKVYERMQRLQTRNPLHICGFVNNVDAYMDASDCIVTKPGGLTSTEAMAKRLPMILVDPIPGQEERNRDFLVNNGVAVAVSSTFSITEAVYYIFSNPKKLEVMGQCLDLIAHPDATARLCDFIEKLGSVPHRARPKPEA